RMTGGLHDTLRVLIDVARENKSALVDKLTKIDRELIHTPRTISSAISQLERTLAALSDVSTKIAPEEGEVRHWARTFETACRAHRDDLVQLAPWNSIQQTPEFQQIFGELDVPLSLKQIAALHQTLLPRIDEMFVRMSDAAKLKQLRQAVIDASERAAER